MAALTAESRPAVAPAPSPAKLNVNASRAATHSWQSPLTASSPAPPVFPPPSPSGGSDVEQGVSIAVVAIAATLGTLVIFVTLSGLRRWRDASMYTGTDSPARQSPSRFSWLAPGFGGNAGRPRSAGTAGSAGSPSPVPPKRHAAPPVVVVQPDSQVEVAFSEYPKQGMPAEVAGGQGPELRAVQDPQCPHQQDRVCAVQPSTAAVQPNGWGDDVEAGAHMEGGVEWGGRRGGLVASISGSSVGGVEVGGGDLPIAVAVVEVGEGWKWHPRS